MMFSLLKLAKKRLNILINLLEYSIELFRIIDRLNMLFNKTNFSKHYRLILMILETIYIF